MLGCIENEASFCDVFGMKDDELRQYLLDIRARLARVETLQRAILKKVRAQDEDEISIEELVERLTGTSYDNPNKKNTQ